MAILPVRLFGDPVLTTPADPVTTFDAELRRLVRNLDQTLYDQRGSGLAAPQVGVGLRLVVVDLMANETPDPLVLVNPEIVAASEDLATREEGCLSLPGQYADVARPARVRVRYRDLEGAARELDAEGLLAACLQHEIDQLDGVFWIERLSRLKRERVLKRYAKARRG